MLLFAGCAKDEIFSENAGNNELKKANVPIPFRAELCGTPDMESELLPMPIPNSNSYTRKGKFLNGIVTHVGIVDSEKSYSEITSMQFIMEEGKPFLLQAGTGIIVAKNGDSYRFNGLTKVSLPDLSFTSTTEIIPGSGTGRFEGISGYTSGGGQVDVVNNTTCWVNEGWMIYE